MEIVINNEVISEDKAVTTEESVRRVNALFNAKESTCKI